MIKLNHLHYSHDKAPFIEDLNLQIQKGRFCALLGPNGSGKSTLLKLMVGLLKPQQGEILISNSDIKNLNANELAQKISYVPQREDIIFEFSVYDTVMMGRNPYQGRWQAPNDEDHKLVQETLRRTNLDHLQHRMLSQLSGGELQRTLIARAIVQQTPIMLLDEPLANIDIAHKYEIMDILSALQHDTGVTIIVVLHDFSIASQYCDDTVLMSEGKIIKQGAFKEVITDDSLKDIFHLDNRFYLDNQGNINTKTTID